MVSQRTSDHDLLIALTVEVKALRDDIKEMKDTIYKTVTDHETRLRALESESNQHKWLWPAIASIAGAGLTVFASKIFHL